MMAHVIKIGGTRFGTRILDTNLKPHDIIRCHILV